MALGIGWSWGSGVLTYKGKTHKCKVEGLSVGEVGVTKAEATGSVYNLKSLDAFSGTYAAAGTGAAAGKGVEVSSLKNDKGVVINLKSATKGASIKVAAEGLKLTLESRSIEGRRQVRCRLLSCFEDLLSESPRGDSVTETSSNIEVAHRIHEHGHSGGGPHSPRTERLEILEALALAAVAILTAWSGYQAAIWNGKSAESYVLSAGATARSQELQTLAGQERLYDITTFEGWPTRRWPEMPRRRRLSSAASARSTRSPSRPG